MDDKKNFTPRLFLESSDDVKFPSKLSGNPTLNVFIRYGCDRVLPLVDIDNDGVMI